MGILNIMGSRRRIEKQPQIIDLKSCRRILE